MQIGQDVRALFRAAWPSIAERARGRARGSFLAAFLAALASALVFLSDRLTVVGDRFKLFLLGYLFFRLLVDFIKPGVRVGGLSTIQWICLAVIAFYAPHARRLILEVRSG